MPTSLPRRQPKSTDSREPGLRDLMIAATLLLSVLCLLCERSLGPTSGYSLVENHGDLQLSP